MKRPILLVRTNIITIPANDNLLVSEDSKIYKNIKNLSTEELALKASKQQEISLLQNLIRNYQDRIDLLQQELGQYKSE